ncbi:MAG: hypothetical protein WD403_07505, partial [Pirellulales bacterium]
MLDELMDSLVLNKLPSRQDLDQTLDELAHAAEDLDPILHSFKNTQQLRVGVRDILGKEDIQATTGALSDIAETCLARITQTQYEMLVGKLGRPTIGEGPRAGEPCALAVLALGKLGGRELSYHSDLDLVFLYEADGPTVPLRRSRGTATNNQHFFSELGQRIIKVANRLGPYGKLYEVDPRLRPTGKSGALATTLQELARYFAEGQAQLWERQALTRARLAIAAPAETMPDLRQSVEQLLARSAYDHTWQPADAAAIREMRGRVEAGASANNIKRGPGGIVDIEFLMQMLQLKHGRENPDLRTPNTLAALSALHEAGHLASGDFELFTRGYR